MSVSAADADLILTLNGTDITDSPHIMQGGGDLVVAIAGSTPFEPNDLSVVASGGFLEADPDANNTYYFEFYIGGGEASVSLVTNVDMIIDGNEVPANTTIYELWLFYNIESNILGACGIGLDYFLPPEQGAGTQESTGAEEESTSYKFVPVTPYAEQKQQEKLKSLKYCPPAEFPEAKAELLRTEKDIDDQTVTGENYGNEMLLDGDIIIVDSDITSNQIWTGNNIYHIVADINIQALLVIEPGTVVKFAYDTGMFINNGGTLISCGTPDNPIIYTSDSEYPDYDYYFCAIYIEQTASASTKITYSHIECAQFGIAILNRHLDTNIENNYFYYNDYAIVEKGTELTDISNNLIFDSYNSAIDVNFVSATGQADANSHIIIQNNTSDYCGYSGITIRGVQNINDAGSVVVVNNLASECYYGLNLVNGYMYADVLNTGYYANSYNKNWVFEETDPVIETDWPYRDGSGWMPIRYLDQNCSFINAGYEYLEQTHLIGKTTDASSSPDCNKTDIGFHYPNWNFSNAGNATDLNNDLIVDFKDFAILANGWQTAYQMADLAIMASEWLQAEPNIEINIYGDSRSGYVDVGISGFTSDTQRVFLLADGKYVEEIFGFENGDTLGIDISESGGQEQQLKAVSINNNGRVTCSNIKNVAFSCPLNYCLLSESYEPNKPCYFSAFNPAAGNVSVNVYADGGNLVWSQTYSGNSILGSIPAEITSQHEIDYVSFDTSGGGWSITKISDPAEPDLSFDIKALIILPNLGIRLCDFRTIWAVQKAFKDRGVKYKRLGGQSANYDNITWYAGTNPVKYIYIGAHGGYALGGVLRTYVVLSDGRAVSVKRTDFIDPNNAPP